ncbi:GNAT family N-acetyltransferase [Paenibacillus sp. P22]|uniref:GNAT family N-acetyltransferase n=1 Tax=Paenibacillus sp. P22 TaxID=483908 RepID=UPI0004257292|nr:GNAT family protein [Paenibacillus sp. P22]
MTVSHAREIARWSYAPPYDFYDMGEDDETVEELMRYTAVLKGDGLFGFYCLGSWAQVPAGRGLGYYREGSGAVDIGLGMNPEHAGRGEGKRFVSYVAAEAVRIASPSLLRLTVASFNLRAKKVYERLGFRVVGKFRSGTAEFEVMELLAREHFPAQTR